MKHLAALNKYFWKYRFRLVAGILVITLSNFFAILSPQLSGFVINLVQSAISSHSTPADVVRYDKDAHYNQLVHWFIQWVNNQEFTYGKVVILAGVMLLFVALLRGFFMFLMRQTINVMSRYIEYDQKNEVYQHYQKLDAGFFKTHSTGDLMNRITEDVSRVRMYVGPALMYFINLASTIGFCLFYMFKQNVELSLYVLSPLPILAGTIYFVNIIINKKSQRVQALLSDLTTNAQESYSGIRVIKSFVQEKSMLGFFNKNSEAYRQNAVSLAKVEAIYFPSMTLLIGLSTIIAILIGGLQVLHGTLQIGVIVEFVIYINMLTFPVSAIGWTASMIQRAAASQKRINEFLQTEPAIQSAPDAEAKPLRGDIVFDHVSFTYANTGIKAIADFNLTVKEGQKVLVIGRTGSGKTTLAQLLLRFYDPASGRITIGGNDIAKLPVHNLREQISYVPQDVFLFSDTVANNISFGLAKAAGMDEVRLAATYASVDKEISGLPGGYETMVGERGVTLSGGQKQRVSIARGLIKTPDILLFDDCLSAVDAKTENEIIHHLYTFLQNKTAIIITHRIFTVLNFDKIVVLDEGGIIEEGTHEQLLASNGYYAELYRLQMTSNERDDTATLN
ncbi:MAG: ABC transporter ATP-binding protein [Filimonas sp.]|nr:ABC transporter ATP-binding protein [Filimonas sp.]